MLEFDPATHTYTYLGKVVPSVTQILDRVGVRKPDSNGIERWQPIGGSFGKNDEVAANFGTALHAYIAFAERGVECDYDPELQPWIDQYHRFRELFPPGEIVGVEMQLFHPGMQIAGMVDLMEYRAKRLFIWDWKSAEQASKVWGYQLAGYSLLAKHHLTINVSIELATVRFTKDNFFVDYWNDPMAEVYFRSMANVYRMAA